MQEIWYSFVNVLKLLIEDDAQFTMVAMVSFKSADRRRSGRHGSDSWSFSDRINEVAPSTRCYARINYSRHELSGGTMGRLLVNTRLTRCDHWQWHPSERLRQMPLKWVVSVTSAIFYDVTIIDVCLRWFLSVIARVVSKSHTVPTCCQSTLFVQNYLHVIRIRSIVMVLNNTQLKIRSMTSQSSNLIWIFGSDIQLQI